MDYGQILNVANHPSLPDYNAQECIVESTLYNKNDIWGLGRFYLDLVEGVLNSQFVRELWPDPSWTAEDKRGNQNNEKLLEYLED